MFDEGLGPVDLTGRWVGFYRYRSKHLDAFPITAEIRQEDDRLVGEMYDQVTDYKEVLDRLVETYESEINPWNKRRIEAAIERFGTGAVMVSSHLPETSVIEGKVAGDFVRFTKTYQGAYEITWSVDGKNVGTSTRRGHRVLYSGHLDRETGHIFGEWVIPFRGYLGRFLPPVARGTFELYRKSLAHGSR